MGLKNKKDFLLGVSSAAQQIEGDDGTQGRGKSVWDVFCSGNRIYKHQTSAVATDHYNRYGEDVKLIAELGANSYRFSISWSRLFPNGTGDINQKGIDFYNKLIDGLLENNVLPMITLYHWDLPQALFEKGGFANPDFPKWFSEYSELVAKKYGDRIRIVCPFNEPINIIHSGLFTGTFAPGIRLKERQILDCMLNLSLAQGESAKILHNNIKDVTVSTYAMSTFEEYPASNDKETVSVARKKFFEKETCSESLDAYLDPLFFGKFPQRIYDKYPDFQGTVENANLIQYLPYYDVMSYNNYGGNPIDKSGNDCRNYLKAEYTDMGGIVDPMGMYWGIKFLTERYKLPVYVTENGLANLDWVAPDGKIYDLNRIEYIKKHINIVDKLIDEGIDVRGYFVWSLTDNFEWLFGYSKRFGLVHIDYETMKRTPKESYYWYKKFISENL